MNLIPATHSKNAGTGPCLLLCYITFLVNKKSVNWRQGLLKLGWWNSYKFFVYVQLQLLSSPGYIPLIHKVAVAVAVPRALTHPYTITDAGFWTSHLLCSGLFISSSALDWSKNVFLSNTQHSGLLLLLPSFLELAVSINLKMRVFFNRRLVEKDLQGIIFHFYLLFTQCPSFIWSEVCSGVYHDCTLNELKALAEW